MKIYVECLILFVFSLVNIFGADSLEDQELDRSKKYYNEFKNIDDAAIKERNKISYQSQDKLKEIFNSTNLYNPTKNAAGGNIDMLVNNILGSLYTRKAFIKLSTKQFVDVVVNCQDYFKTQFGFSLIHGWMLNRLDEVITPYYVGKFFSFKKMFEGMMEKFSSNRHYSTVIGTIRHCVFFEAMKNIQEDRWSYYFDCALWLHSAIDHVKTENPLRTKKSNLEPSMQNIINKSFIGLKAQKEEAEGYKQSDGKAVKGIGWPFGSKSTDSATNTNMHTNRVNDESRPIKAVDDSVANVHINPVNDESKPIKDEAIQDKSTQGKNKLEQIALKQRAYQRNIFMVIGGALLLGGGLAWYTLNRPNLREDNEIIWSIFKMKHPLSWYHYLSLPGFYSYLDKFHCFFDNRNLA